jgi:outer membrane protein assembly factor BamB/tetratricopeptide (TPR) repeat protein
MASTAGGETKRIGKSQSGALTNAFFAKQLESVKDAGEVFTLSVSTGDNERVFFFTRGAILFAALGTTGGQILARRILARNLLDMDKLDDLFALRDVDRPLLQDVIKASEAIDGPVLSKLVEEVIEEHLLEVATWDSSIALFELIHSTAPGRLYAQSTPAVRLSIGLNGLLARVLPKIAEVPDKILAPLGGTIKTQLRLGIDRTPPPDAAQQQLLGLFSNEWRTCQQAVTEAYALGFSAYDAARGIAALVQARRLAVDPAALSKEDELAAAQKIEASLDQFLNGLLARSHLAKIYERAEEKEKAVHELRFVAREHLLRDRINDALGALKNALKLGPTDLPAREEMIKVLVQAKRTPEAASEAVELGRQLLSRGLPGRARRALELSLKLVPGAQGVLWMLAGLVERLGDKPEAIKRYGQVADLASEKGDTAACLAANQKLLELDPENEAARRKVLIFSGYRRALMVRVATGAAAVFFAVFILGYFTYQMFALKAFAEAREKIWAAIDEERFDGARSIVLDLRRDWGLAPRVLRATADALGMIDVEEGFAADRRCKRALRTATRLVSEQRLPEAVETLRAALPFAATSSTRRAPLEAALQLNEPRVAEGQKALATANGATGRQRHDILAQALEGFPWLRRTQGLTVPCEIDSVPLHAHVALDDAPLAEPTPVVVDLPLAPSRLVVAAPNCEQVVQKVVSLPPWPFSVVLPRRRVWRVPDVTGTRQPAVGESIVVAVGDDRTVAAVARDRGAVVWRTSLGVFGDTDLPPLVVGNTVYVRTNDGTVVALDASSGSERWRREIRPPPPDAADAAAGRPLALGDGVVVREGGQGLVALAADGSARWRALVRGNVVGAPAPGAPFVFAASGRRLEAFVASTGVLARATDLSQPATTGPVVGPEGGVFVGVEGGAIARFDASGVATGVSKPIAPSGFAALDGTSTQLVVASASGDVLVFDAHVRAPLFRVALETGVVPRWVKLVAQGFVLVGDARGIYVFDARGAEQWRDLTSPGPAAADDALIYQCGPGGLSAVER